MDAIKDLTWLFAVIIIAWAALERITHGSAGWLALAVIPASLYLFGSFFTAMEKRR
jgi:hypothetical protein